MVEVSRLTKYYSDLLAIQDISFTAHRGQILGLLGPNGAGKSTIMRIIAGFIPPTEGNVLVDGFGVFRESHEVRRRLGYLPENPPLYPDMTVSSYLRFVARIKGVPKKQITACLEATLEKCSLESVAYRLLGHLSKGYRQRAGLAQALVHNPPVLILDEPTLGLDPNQIIEIRSLIKELAGDRTVILSTHILPEVSQICDKVVIINEGKVVVEKDLKELTQDLTLEEVFVYYISKESKEKEAQGEESLLQWRNIVTIASKEIRSLFVSPVAYVVLTGFLLLGGWFFFNLLFRFDYLLTLYTGFRRFQALPSLNLNEHVMAPLLHNLTIIFVILVPIVTMRSFAEEKKSGTYELLLTSPLTIFEIVMGKFLGCLFFLFVMILATGVYPALLLYYGNPEIGVLASGYLGLFLVGTAFVSIGLLTSSLTENQIIAAVTCFVTLLLLYVLSWPAESTGTIGGEVLKYLSVIDHFSEMVKGVIDTKDLFYFATLTVFCLFLTQRSVESSRWR